MGVSDALRPHGVVVQAHEPAGSAAIGGGERGPFLIQGWTGIVMPHWDPAKVDHLEAIAGEEAVDMTRRLAAEDGIFAGISTGAILHAALGQAAKAVKAGERADIAFIVADGGWKYLSTGAYEGTIDEAEEKLEGQLWA